MNSQALLQYIILSLVALVAYAQNSTSPSFTNSTSTRTTSTQTDTTSTITGFITQTVVVSVSNTSIAASTGTSPHSGGLNLASASSCNSLKWDWMAEGGQTYVSDRTFTTVRYNDSISFIRTGYYVTEPADPGPAYTLCDGWPRLNATLTTTTVDETKVFSSLITSLATTPVYRNITAPNCTIPPRECSYMQSEYSSASSANYAYWHNNNSATTLSFVTTPLSPVCGSPTLRTLVTSLGPAACAVNTATLQLLYWPVQTVGDRLCGNYSTVTATPTIPDQPNTAVTFGTTFTSPTVYMLFEGAYTLSEDWNIGSTLTAILPMSSTAVSSLCFSVSASIGEPRSINYADFNYPVPASAYRCQPQCFTTPDWPGRDGNIYATENLCSTIFNNYDPALAVPVSEFKSYFSTGIAVSGNNGICSVMPYSDGIFYDPPIALNPVSSVPGPTVPNPADPGTITSPGSGATSKPPKPSQSGTSAPAELPPVSAPGMPTDPAGSDPSPSPDPPPSPSPSDPSQDPSPADSDTPPNNSAPPTALPDSTSNGGVDLGSIIASVIGASQAPGGNTPAPGGNNPAPSSNDPAAADPAPTDAAGIFSSILNPPAPSGGGSGGNGEGSPSTDPVGAPAGDPAPSQGGVVLTNSNGQAVTAITSGGSVILPSATIPIGQVTSVPGLGVISVGSSGVVQNGQTVGFTQIPGITPGPGSPGSSGAPVLTIGGQTVTAGADGAFTLGSGTTLTLGGVATISGTTVSLPASGSAVVVNGQTSTLGSAGSSTGGPALLVVDGKTYTAGADGAFTIAPGTTLTPGGVATIDGTTVSMPTEGSAVIINGQTSTLGNAGTSASGPALLTIDGTTYTAGAGGAFTIGPGTTLTPGGVITADGTTISLRPTSSGLPEVVVVNGVTETLSDAAPTGTDGGAAPSSTQEAGAPPIRATCAIGVAGALFFACLAVI